MSDEFDPQAGPADVPLPEQAPAAPPPDREEIINRNVRSPWANWPKTRASMTTLMSGSIKDW